MDQAPNYLDIEEELNQGITMQKEIILDYVGFSYQLTINLHYDSHRREINLNEGIATVLSIYRPIIEENDEFEAYIYDQFAGCYVYVGIYPGRLRVSEQFLEVQTLFLKLNATQERERKEEKIKKTIEDVLVLGARWRQVQLKHRFKLSFAQAAAILDVSRRTLEDYIGMIRLGEKYGYPFQAKVREKVADLRKFIKQNHQVKKGGENLPVLVKYMQGEFD